MIAADSLGRAVDRARAVDSQIQFRYGFLPVELTDRSREYFGATGGLLVKEVWWDTLAWNLGVRPGDIVTALDVDPANRLEDLAMMTVPMYRPEYELTIRRGRVSRKVTFPPGAGLADEPEAGRRVAIAFQDTPTGAGIRHIQPGSAAAIAGLRAGDRVVSMGPQFGVGRIDPTQINAPRDKPLFLVVEREERLLGLFLE
jgi:S1-C subfamily serine protease